MKPEFDISIASKDAEEQNRLCDEIAVQKRIQPLKNRMAEFVVLKKRPYRSADEPDESDRAPDSERNDHRKWSIMVVTCQSGALGR